MKSGSNGPGPHNLNRQWAIAPIVWSAGDDSLSTVLHAQASSPKVLPVSLPSISSFPSPRSLSHSHSVSHLPAMPVNGGSRPPPMIAKMGPYTVFITPPPTPLEQTLKSGPMPVQPPPQRFHKAVQGGSVLGFFKNAATKVQSGKFPSFST